jgi:Transposase DDE domain
VGGDLANAVEPARCPRQARVSAGLPGGEFRAGEKGGSGVGKTKVGKGSKVMLVAVALGLPIGLEVDSAQPHETQLADATLATIGVPQQRGRLRTQPKGLVADKAYDSREFRQRLRRWGIKPTISTFGRRMRRQPKRGVRSKRGRVIGSAGKSNTASGGWITVGDWSDAMHER